jgi:hypothetical protein
MDWMAGRRAVLMAPPSKPRKPTKKAAKAPAKKGGKRVPHIIGQAKPLREARKPSTTKASSKAKAKPAKATTAKPPAKSGKRVPHIIGQAKEAEPGPRAAPARPALVEFREVRDDGTTAANEASKPLRIALFGASGDVGSRIAEEAVARGHSVTALVRHPDQMTGDHPRLRKVRGDVTDPLQVGISAIAPPANEPAVLAYAAKALLAAGRETGKRVVAVGGAGSLQAAPGKDLLDTPGFPKAWLPVAKAHRDALNVFRKGGDGVAWTVVSPSAFIEPGERTGSFRLGTEELLKDKKGESRISMEDYAVAFVDEIERGDNVGRRMTVGY